MKKRICIWLSIIVSLSNSITWTVGNDSSVAHYDFNQLSDALVAAADLQGYIANNGTSPIIIKIPEGTHTFNSIHLRGVDLSHVQVWGSGNTVIECIPSHGTHGTWLHGQWSQFGDWGAMELVPASTVGDYTDPIEVCQRWYGSRNPIDSTYKSFTFIHLENSSWVRLWGTRLNGGTDSNKCRYGTAINMSSTYFHNLNNVYINNMRQALVVYANSRLFVPYGGVHAEQVFEFLINHESTVRLRRVSASAFNIDGVSIGKSLFVDTFRGETTLWECNSGKQIAGFDALFFLNLGTVKCQIDQFNFVGYNTILHDYGANNQLYSNLPLTTAELLSDNTFGYYELNNNHNSVPTLSPRMGVITYSGDNSSERKIIQEPYVTEITIRNKSTGVLLPVVRGNAATLDGNIACWINESDNTIRVNPIMNKLGVDYELIWKR